MVIHNDIAQKLEVIFFRMLLKKVQKSKFIFVSAKDEFFIIASLKNVINRTGNVYSQLSGHDKTSIAC